MLDKIFLATICFSEAYQWPKGLTATLIVLEAILAIVLFIPFIMISACICAMFK